MTFGAKRRNAVRVIGWSIEQQQQQKKERKKERNKETKKIGRVSGTSTSSACVFREME